MTRRREGQRGFGQVVLFGLLGPPETLLDPALRRIDGLLDDEALVGVAVERQVTRGRRLRVDTTVVEAPIRYPTDSGLCEDSIRVLRRGVRRLVAVGIRLRGGVRDVRRSVSRRMREIGQALRRRGEAARTALRRPYRGLLRITRRVVRETRRSVAAARRQLRRLPPPAQRQARRALTRLATMLPRVQQVVRQTRGRIVHGVTTGADKLVSLS